YGYDAGGQVTSTIGVYTKPDELLPNTPVETPYLLHIGYDEFNQRTRVVLGNGIETRYTYDPLMRRLATADTNHEDAFMAMQAQPPLPFQRLRYEYDLVGNVLEVDNDVPVTDHQSQNSPQVGPVAQSYQYDDMYQLVSTSGLYQFDSNR